MKVWDSMQLRGRDSYCIESTRIKTKIGSLSVFCLDIQRTKSQNTISSMGD
jgi:hypothetical protein